MRFRRELAHELEVPGADGGVVRVGGEAENVVGIGHGLELLLVVELVVVEIFKRERTAKDRTQSR